MRQIATKQENQVQARFQVSYRAGRQIRRIQLAGNVNKLAALLMARALNGVLIELK